MFSLLQKSRPLSPDRIFVAQFQHVSALTQRCVAMKKSWDKTRDLLFVKQPNLAAELLLNSLSIVVLIRRIHKKRKCSEQSTIYSPGYFHLLFCQTEQTQEASTSTQTQTSKEKERKTLRMVIKATNTTTILFHRRRK